MKAVWLLLHTQGLKQKTHISVGAGIWGAAWNGKPESLLYLTQGQQGNYT